ncbi:MAG TPA: sulfatase [Planctomycetaceae bacterium]|nr:sulfatase [Planctomycetaceae bacterium]
MSPNLGCYGDPLAMTPNIDRLASDGVIYTHAFSVCGVCAPGRSAIITGMYPSSIGSHGMRSRTRLPDAVKCFPQYLRRAGYYCTNNVKTDYNFPVPPGAWDESSRQAHWKKRAPGQPFFSVFNITTTHESQIRCSQQQYERYMAGFPRQVRHDPQRIPVPPYHPDVPEVRRDWARYYDLITAMDRQAGRLLDELAEAGLADETIVFFYSDHGAGMPRCKKWAYDCGTRVPLIIHFPEKYRHLAPAERGGRVDRLVSFVDFAPTVLSLAGLPIPDHIQGRAFLGPQASAPRRYVYAMTDRMAERYDMVRTVRDERYLYMRNYMPHLTYAQHVSYTYQMPTMQAWARLAAQGMLSGPPALWFRCPKPLEELYDTQRDAYQIHNLADDPQYRPVLERMRAAHRQWVLETRDLGFLPEYDMLQRSQQSTPYEMGQSPQAYPLEQILAVADLVGRGPGTLEPLIDHLADRDSAVRYWAATGLVALGSDACDAEKALRGALQDPSPVVRITAAEALLRCGSAADLLRVLVQAVGHEHEWVRLRAANVLDRMGPRARDTLPAIREAMNKKSQFGYDRRAFRTILEKLAG